VKKEIFNWEVFIISKALSSRIVTTTKLYFTIGNRLKMPAEIK